ncbi:MAG: acyl-CoA dehydrogenase family protein [Acidobacteria bacterium]|nr:acyl-CoA dehydrogenase family protein [Acidobacteriota bacterium]MBI3471984.1 acyl-CoA dehydrogenase family protein [Candidatus Solibacter usitatus]
MATAILTIPKTKGGAFLIEDRASHEIFTAEDLTEEHQAIGRTADEFWKKEVEPNLEEIGHGNHDLAVKVLKKSGELGLTAILTPERYGGMELDLVSAMVAAEHMSLDGSYSGWHGAHSGIGTTPLLLFGSDEQKRKYLPKLSSAEMIGAYCLSEPHAGSDALAAKTRADLSPDGRHYVLNGQKMWITNGGKADLFTIFAKVGGEKFTAFLVEKAFAGVSCGAEEKKMGIKGSSTCAIYLDNVHVPVENVLGEIGRGHIIAFNILNLGRLKLGPFAVGGSKNVLAISAKYAKERKAFGTTISEFGMIQHKLAEMAIRIFAAETMSWRVVGLIEAQLEGFSFNWSQPDAAHTYMKAVEEFAAECSIIKVYASEVLDYVVDEGVQIHGGYGFHQDYRVERAYRDSRINRIFEGTNEINRLLTTGLLLKRAQKGQLGLVQAAQGVMAEILGGPSLADSGVDEETRLMRNAKKIALMLMGVAYQKHLAALEKQQEVIAGMTDVVMDVFAMESVLLRARRLAEMGKKDQAGDICSVFLRDALAHIEVTARTVLASCSEGDTLRGHMAVLRRFAKYEPVDAIAARRRIARRILDAERYVI